MLGHQPVGRAFEDQVGLAGRQPHVEDLLPERAGVDELDHLAGLRAAQAELGPVAHRLHEFVGHRQAVVQVERLAIEVAGRLADLEELLDLGVVDVEIDRRRAAAERALADRQRQGVHHADEGDDAAGLALALHLLADRAHAAPIGADAAAVGGQPHVLVPGADDAFEAVGDGVQEAGDRQAAIGAAVRQHRRRRHEPEPARCSRRCAGRGRRRRRRPSPRGRTCPGRTCPAAGSGPRAWSCRSRSAARRAIGRPRPCAPGAAGAARPVAWP